MDFGNANTLVFHELFSILETQIECTVSCFGTQLIDCFAKWILIWISKPLKQKCQIQNRLKYIISDCIELNNIRNPKNLNWKWINISIPDLRWLWLFQYESMGNWLGEYSMCNFNLHMVLYTDACFGMKCHGILSFIEAHAVDRFTNNFQPNYWLVIILMIILVLKRFQIDETLNF